MDIARKLVRVEHATNGGRPDPALLRRGFFSAKRALYPFDAFPPEAFLNDWAIETRLLRVNAPDIVSRLSDKPTLHELCSNGALPLRMPRLIGLCEDGVLTVGAWDGEPAVLKPQDGSGGRGVRRIIAGDALPRRGAFLLEAPVHAVPAIERIFSGALSTLRVLTARDEGGAFVLGAAHRFGTERSGPTDNFKRGGIVCGVEADGSLSEAVLFPSGPTRRVTADHPDTGVRVQGLALPHFERAAELAAAAMLALPGLLYAGWDFALTSEGPVLIEANVALPNPNLLQAHRPLLADERARAFFEATGVIGAEGARSAARAVS